MFYFQINGLKHLGREKSGFHLFRANGSGDYVFVHFITPVQISLGKDSFQTMPNACLIYSPNCRHDFYVTDIPLIHDWIHFIPQDPPIFERTNLSLDTIFYPGISSLITDTIKKIETEFLNRRPFWEIKASGLLLFLLGSLGQHMVESSLSHSSYMDELRVKFESLRIEVYSNPAEWDVDSMAKQIGLCRSRFSILYRIFFNISPGEDLNLACLERAKYLLTTTKTKIRSIATDIGYESIEYFTRWFKMKTGSSPGEYRRQSR